MLLPRLEHQRFTTAAGVDRVLHASAAWVKPGRRSELGHQPGQQHEGRRNLLPRSFRERWRLHTQRPRPGRCQPEDSLPRSAQLYALQRLGVLPPERSLPLVHRWRFDWVNSLRMGFALALRLGPNLWTGVCQHQQPGPVQRPVHARPEPLGSSNLGTQRYHWPVGLGLPDCRPRTLGL